MRNIRFGSKFDPNKSEIVNNMGARELVLVTLAAGQAIWLIFVQVQMEFALRFTIAGLIVLVLLAIALVPIKDKPIEWHLIQFVRYKLRPSMRIHQTALHKPDEILEEVATAAPIPAPTPATSTRAPTVPRRRARAAAAVGSLDLLAPDPTLVLATFACMLILGSAIAYVGRGGLFNLRIAHASQSQ